MPVLTPRQADTVPPRIDVLFEEADLSPATVAVSVLQISSAGEFPVRNATLQGAIGGFFVTDYEMPLGVQVEYRAEQFDADGLSLGWTGSASAQVDIDPQFLVVQDPLAPKRFVVVDAPPSFGSSVVRRRPVSRYRVGGRTVALMGELGLLEGVPVDMNTRTLVVANVLDDVLAEAPFLIRCMPNITRLPALFYGVLAEIAQNPVDVDYGGEWVRWALTADEVTRIDLDIIEPVVTYARFAAVFATYAEAKAVYATYPDAKQNPPSEV